MSKENFPENAICFIESKDRNVVYEICKLRNLIDVVIPRGSATLIRTVVENSFVPVIETGEGVCHVFIDQAADLEKASRIIINAKTQRCSVCNAAETLLVHRALAQNYLPGLISELQKSGVEVRGCKETLSVCGNIKAANDSDWSCEYLDLILAVRVVADVKEAVQHINRYGTKHSESIVSEDKNTIEFFFNNIDSAVVYSNASTRFTDGGEFGFGAEIGISTQKLHARGPMGLAELTTYKYLVTGSGQIRE